jgi:outer membrane protein assembly factor BamB
MGNSREKIKLLKISKNKLKTTVFALFLILSVAASSILLALPAANAHDPPWTFPTTAYVTCAPGIVGVGQYTTIICWLDRYSPTSGGANGQVWEGWQLNITKPNGDREIIGPWTCSSALASDFIVFVPDQVGNYTIVFSWPGGVVEPSEGVITRTQANALAGIGDIFLGATSEPTILRVTDEPNADWPESSLPTNEFWTRPINAQNRQWSTLASNWLKGTWLTNNYQGGIAPNSAHVLWTAPMQASSPDVAGYAGGLVDAQWPSIQYNINDYVDAWSQPIIMNGVVYYNAPPTAQSCQYGYYAMDLYTGQQIWFKNGTDNGLDNPYTISQPGGEVAPSYGQSYLKLTLGQLLRSQTINGDGVASYLWIQSGTTWYMLDPTTGNLILTLKNVPSGTSATDQNGNLLRYSYNANTGNLLCWNSTQAIYPGGPTGTAQQVWHPPVGAVIDAVNDTSWLNATTTWGTGFDQAIKDALKVPHSGYTMNVTIDKGLKGSMTILRDDDHVPRQIFGSAITTNFGSMGSIGGAVNDDNIAIWLATINEHATDYSPFPNVPGTLNNNLGFTVTLDYNKNFTVPLPGKNHTWSIGPVDYNSKIFILTCQQTTQKWAYSLTTGALLWGPTEPLGPMGYYTFGTGSGITGGVYDGIYVAANAYNLNGEIYAYNATTGAKLWKYSAPTTYHYESYYGNNMPLSLLFVCDGKVFLASTEHSPTQPLFRESYLRCVNLTDGTEIWKLAQYSTGVVQAVADGYIISNSQYDNLIYCIGKGPSATTVEAPLTGTPAGSTQIIQGTVTDQSPGAIAHATKYGLLNGVAAVSDESQGVWMEYIYQQQAKPTNATGILVSIDALDPNNNYIHIGDAVSDLSGHFSYAWTTPDVPGKYTIIATFAGSASYGSSFAETATYVEDQQAPASTPTAIPLSIADTYFVPAIVGLFVLIVIVLALLIVLLLRKRP